MTSGVLDMSEGKAYESWRIPQCPFSIECSAALLDRIRREVESGLLARRGEEKGGVLFGRNNPDHIQILAFRPLACEHAMGPGFVLTEQDEKHLADLIASPGIDPELNGLAALGWYHSHIHSKIFLSERDLRIHSRYFPAPFQVALVLRPDANKPTRAGFFFWEPAGRMRTDSSYEEFTLKTPPPEPKVCQPAPSLAQQPPAPVSLSSQPSPQAEAVCPICGGKRIFRAHRRHAKERIWSLFGLYPYRCEECLSRSFRRRSSGLLELARGFWKKRPEQRRRAWLGTRRQLLLYGLGVLGFLLFLLVITRETEPKQDQP
jgi:JAB1/Mov34/MPN/PAD-1 ubiquitin protease